MTKDRIWLGTSNKHKVKEASEILNEFGIKLEHYPLNRVEIQSDKLEEVALFSLKQVTETFPICVEDAGLFIDSYKGFPGPYSSYILECLGNEGILKLMNGSSNRAARYISAVAYRDERGIKIFNGSVEGKIAQSIRGEHGFGFDPIFIPLEGNGRTFGELSDLEKNSISHRARSFRALGRSLAEI